MGKCSVSFLMQVKRVLRSKSGKILKRKEGRKEVREEGKERGNTLDWGEVGNRHFLPLWS